MPYKNTMSPGTGVLVGAGAGLATAAVLNEAGKAYEIKQSKLTGINGDCSSIPCKDGLVCYKQKCLSSLPKGGCLTDFNCPGEGMKCRNDVCVQTMSDEEKEKSKKRAQIFGIIFGIILFCIVVYVSFMMWKVSKT